MLFISEQWLLVSILSVLVAALIVVEGKKGGKALSHHEVTRLVNDHAAVLLDVRESKDFKKGHIVDSINIPFAVLANRSDELDKFKEKTVVVIDKMGQHAGASGKILKEKGFSVNRLQGGIMEWESQNLPVIKS